MMVYVCICRFFSVLFIENGRRTGHFRTDPYGFFRVNLMGGAYGSVRIRTEIHS